MANYPKKIFRAFLALILLLFLLHLVSYIMVLSGYIDHTHAFFEKVNFDIEKNLPSLFSTLLHFSASALLLKTFFLGGASPKNRFFWISLSIVFLFLGLDELLRIHEMVGRSFSAIVTTSGIFYYSWLVIYGIAVLALGIFYLKPLLKLPAKTRYGFISSGIIFLLGAVGMEMITGWLISIRELKGEHLTTRPEFFILYTIEELLEMFGISYFIFFILKYLKEELNYIPPTWLSNKNFKS